MRVVRLVLLVAFLRRNMGVTLMSDQTGGGTVAAGDETGRPWHGSVNPFEALYQHFTAEIAAMKRPAAAVAPVPAAEPAAVQPSTLPVGNVA